jgi:hypothetical protein
MSRNEKEGRVFSPIASEDGRTFLARLRIDETKTQPILALFLGDLPLRHFREKRSREGRDYLNTRQLRRGFDLNARRGIERDDQK